MYICYGYRYRIDSALANEVDAVLRDAQAYIARDVYQINIDVLKEKTDKLTAAAHKIGELVYRGK